MLTLIVINNLLVVSQLWRGHSPSACDGVFAFNTHTHSPTICIYKTKQHVQKWRSQISFLSIGQLLFTWDVLVSSTSIKKKVLLSNHFEMQVLWKVWQQGKVCTVSPTSISPKQMQQLAFSSSAWNTETLKTICLISTCYLDCSWG